MNLKKQLKLGLFGLALGLFPGLAHAGLSDMFASFGSGAGNYVFSASTVAATSVNSTTATGLILTNPQGSGKNLILQSINIAIASLPAGASTFVVEGSTIPTATAVTHTLPLVVYNNKLGDSTVALGLADASATIPNNKIFRIIGGGPAATVATSTAFPASINDQVRGEIVLTPGTCISVQSLTTAVTAGITVTWTEINQ